VVDEKGKVRDPEVVSSPDERLTSSALASLKLRRYEPARKDGRPVAVWTKAQIGFRASGEAKWLEDHCDASGFANVPPVEEGPGVVAARKLREVLPKTPEWTLTRPWQPKQAHLECVIDVCGVPTRCRALSADDEDWANRCLDAAREERWRPARRDGEAVPSFFRWTCRLAG
jgi:TonB-like protein